MTTPKTPRTAAATAAVRRRGQETAARKLREAGWLCFPPEVAADLATKLIKLGYDERMSR